MTKKFKFLKKAPKKNQTYFLLTFRRSSNSYVKLTWDDAEIEHRWLKSYRVYSTIKDVKRAAKFVKDFIKSHKEQLNYITSEPKPETKVWYGIDMDGTSNDLGHFFFDPSNEDHQLSLKLGLLYNNPCMVQKASKIITKALAMEQKRFKYKLIRQS